jgi:hypothetical protein
LILGDDQISLEQALNIFDCFSVCAGLRVNLDKTEAIWVGSRLGSDEKLLPEKHLVWNTSGISSKIFHGDIFKFVKPRHF